MTAPSSSGLCAMVVERAVAGGPARRCRWGRRVLGVVGLAVAIGAWGAEAPEVPEPDPAPLPPQAEAADQDLKRRERERAPLDEAVFTEISPLTIPEVGIRLPPDQEM